MSENLFDKERRIRNYARTAVLIMLKSFYDVLGAENTEQLTVEFTIGPHVYIKPRLKLELTNKIYSAVWTKMHDYIEANLPIKKETIKVTDAYDKCMEDDDTNAAEFLHFRRNSRITVSCFEGMKVYFYGSVLKRSGQLKAFDIMPYKNGFFLMLPDDPDNIEEILPFEMPEKFFDAYNESFMIAHLLGTDNIIAINKAICGGNSTNLILTCESIFDNRLALTAQKIVSKGKKFIFIAGPSSSGKTSTAKRLSYSLKTYGVEPRIISLDDYYKDRSMLNEKVDIESIDALDVEQFTRDMKELLNGNEVELPHFNFVTEKREYRGEKISLGKKDLIIIEGIHGLNNHFSENLPQEYIFKIYVSALSQFNITRYNRIPSSDMRLLRRIVRDHRTRGYNALETIRMWPSVRSGEEKNIFPYQKYADVVLNSSMVYELAAIKPYAERVLFCVPRNTPEYIKARELLKFLDFVIPLSTDEIPPASIIREFIGGSCLNVE